MASTGPDPLSRNATLIQASNKVLMVLTRVSKHGDGKHDAIQIEKLLKATTLKTLESLRKPLLEAVRKKFSRRRYRDPSAPGTYPKMLSQELRNSIEVTEIGRGDTATMGNMTGFAIRTRGEGRASNKLMWLSRPNNPWHAPKKSKFIAIPVSMDAKKASTRGNGPRELGKKLVIWGKAGIVTSIAAGMSWKRDKSKKKRRGARRVDLSRPFGPKNKGRPMLVEIKSLDMDSGDVKFVVHYVLWKDELHLSKRRGLDDAVEGCSSLIKSTLEKAQI